MAVVLRYTKNSVCDSDLAAASNSRIPGRNLGGKPSKQRNAKGSISRRHSFCPPGVSRPTFILRGRWSTSLNLNVLRRLHLLQLSVIPGLDLLLHFGEGSSTFG